MDSPPEFASDILTWLEILHHMWLRILSQIPTILSDATETTDYSMAFFTSDDFQFP